MKELHHHHHSLFSCSSEHQRSSLLHCERFWIHANTSYPIINPHCAIRKELNALTGCWVLNITADWTVELYMCITDTWAAGGASPAVCDGSGQNKVHLVVLSIAVCATLTVQVISEYMMRCFKKQMFVFFLFLQSSRWKMWFEKKCLSPESTFLFNLLSHQHFMVFARQSESLVFVFPFRMVQRILNQEAKCQGKRGWRRSLTENFPSPPSSLILFPPVCLRCSDVLFMQLADVSDCSLNVKETYVNKWQTFSLYPRLLCLTSSSSSPRLWCLLSLCQDSFFTQTLLKRTFIFEFLCF